MNSHRTSRNKQITKIGITGASVLVVLFFLPTIIATGVSFLLTPIHMTETWLQESSSELPYFFRDRVALIDEIQSLKAELYTTNDETDMLTRAREENEELRRLAGIATSTRITAGVIGRPNQLPYDVLVIDKGSDDGIVVGAPVFAGSDSIIGVVKSVFSGSAIVSLVTAPDFEVTVYIYGPDIYTNAVGQGGGILRVGVPQGIKLSAGDVVVLPSVDAGYFGKIEVIESLPTRPEQYGYVSTEIPLIQLRLVTVGTEPLVPKSFEEARQIVKENRSSLFSVPVPEHILVDTTSTSTGTQTEAVLPADEN